MVNEELESLATALVAAAHAALKPGEIVDHHLPQPEDRMVVKVSTLSTLFLDELGGWSPAESGPSFRCWRESHRPHRREETS
jgi:hypothetical protein